MIENIRLSFQGILSHKGRSFLTMLGIIIGIAAIIAIVSTIEGTNEQIRQNMLGNRGHTVRVSLYQDDMEYVISSWQPSPAGIPAYGEETMEEILAIPDVVSASLYHLREDYDGSVSAGTSSLTSCRMAGIDEGYFATAGYQIHTGRGILAEDLLRKRKVAVLDDMVTRSLFYGEDPLGQTVEAFGETFTVVGTASQLDSYEIVINSVEEYYNYSDSESQTGFLFVPDTVWPEMFAFDEIQTLLLKASGADEMAAAGKAAADILNLAVESDDGIRYRSEDLLGQARQMQDLRSSTNTMLIWIAAISLLVGGIGVMNIMLVSVTERTREIGLKKAIGARSSVIMGQFLTEAVILTSLGGLLGVLAGIGVARFISWNSQVPVAISWPWVGLAVGISVLTGVIAGFVPSARASRLNPIEALRHE